MRRVIIVSLLLVVLPAFLVWQIDRLRPPASIRLAVGLSGEHEYQTALLYQTFLAQEGVAVEIVPTEGSLAIMDLLQAGEADAGFILNLATLTVEDGAPVHRAKISEDLTALAGVGYIPFWGFYRSELESDGPLDELADLRGRRVSLGEPQSGTRAFSRLLLRASDLSEDDFEVFDAAPDASVELLLDGEIDAMFLVSGMASPAVMRLAMAPEVQIFNLRLAATYARMIQLLRHVDILEGSFSVSDLIPPETKQLVADTSVLAARKDLHPDIQLLLLRAAADAQGKLFDPFPSQMVFPTVSGLILPVSDTTMKYMQRGQTILERYLPFWIASPLERFYWLVLPAILLLYPIVRSTPSAYGVFMRRRVNVWYSRLRDLELRQDELSIADLDARIDELNRLDKQLADGVQMPASYLSMYYGLRYDILVVTDRLRQRKAALAAQDLPRTASPGHLAPRTEDTDASPTDFRESP